MFKVVYKYSACISIATDDITILCDPWFGEAYEGTWTQFPVIKSIPEYVGNFDVVYISHIHPDHYDSASLRILFNYFGEKDILIANWGNKKSNFLEKKIRSDGFKNIIKIANTFDKGNTRIDLIPNETGSISDIDSAILVSSKLSKKSVLNINDCIYNEKHFNKIIALKDQLDIEISLFCLGYTGAGPYPQTYYSPFVEKDHLESKAIEKKKNFFERYKKAIKTIPSMKRLPFAGKYLLQGNLSILNNYRGISDALEVKNFDKDAIVLDDGGDSFFDVESMHASRERLQKYKLPNKYNYQKNYAWRKNINFYPKRQYLKRLMIQSIKRAHLKSECEKNYFYTIYVYDQPDELIKILNNLKPQDHYEPIITFNCNKNKDPFDTEVTEEIHSHIFIESKALFSVLTGLSHWNNYEIGSVYQVRRYPDVFIREMSSYLNYLSIV